LVKLHRTYLTLFFFVPLVAYAGEVRSLPADSTRVEVELDSSASRGYALGEILVTATRLPQTATLSASPVTVLQKAELHQTNAVSLADVLASQPGVFIKNYGGWSGLKTLSQRGLGAEHTVVLINGMRVSNAQNGLVDLGLLAADELGRLELVRGGQSASFGADAVAGVVNAVLSPVTSELNIRAVGGIGSFGYRSYAIAASGSVTDGVGIRASYREEKGDETFPFIFRNGSQSIELTRRNADFKSRLGTIQSDLVMSDLAELSLCGRSFSSERGGGGPVVGPASVSVARQRDEDNLLQATFRLRNLSDPTSPSYRIGFQFHHSFQRYEDRNFIVGASALNNSYKNLDWRVEPVVDFEVTERTRVAWGGEFARTTATGNFLKADVARHSYAGFTALQQQIGTEGAIVRRMLLYPTLRYDVVRTGTETITHWSPQLGAVCSFQEVGGFLTPTFRASVSRNCRAPTFNELFYAGGGGIGNPHLQPERSTSVDVGVDLTLSLAGTHHVQLSYFDIAMQNRIVWVPAGGFAVTPKNLRKVRSNGIELMYRWKVFDERLTVGVNFTSLSARKVEPDSPGDPNVNTHLIYIPQEEAYYYIALKQDFGEGFVQEVSATFAASYTGFRYTTEDNSGFLPSYTLAHANFNARLLVGALAMLVRLEVNNLFDTEYQSVPAYPMPLRSYRATFGVEF
jgi:outer membrane cobalamin receptor